jgi:hypothetical protein
VTHRVSQRFRFAPLLHKPEIAQVADFRNMSGADTMQKTLSYSRPAVLGWPQSLFTSMRPRPVTLLSRPFRPHRSHEWSKGKAVTFIVTLAATQSVTLAAKAAGMSRKAAYALKSRDPAFADAWKVAVAARRQSAPKAPAEGNKAGPAATSISSTARRYPADRKLQEGLRDRVFAKLVALQADSAAVARRAPLA